MDAWLSFTLSAAGMQTLRFVLQKRLKGLGLSTGGATFSRFVFAAPLAATALAALVVLHGSSPPAITPGFLYFAVFGGLMQILGTFMTVALFSERSFAVGIAFTKTEVIQVAVFSALVLGEPVTGSGLTAILVGSIGVILLSRPPGGWSGGRFFNRATGLGLAAGASFGLSAIGYRGATLSVDHIDPLMRALMALTAATSFQVLAMALWLRWREPGEVARVLHYWRATLPVALTSVVGSGLWFAAFALQNAAYVRSIGQVELMFSVVASLLLFRERVRLVEIAGMVLLAASVVTIIWVA